MERYGVQAGLRKIAETHPDLAEHILRWAEERYRRQLPASPPTYEAETSPAE